MNDSTFFFLIGIAKWVLDGDVEWAMVDLMEDVEEMETADGEEEEVAENREMLEMLDLVAYPITLQMLLWLVQGSLLETYLPMMLDLLRNFWKKLSIHMATF